MLLITIINQNFQGRTLRLPLLVGAKIRRDDYQEFSSSQIDNISGCVLRIFMYGKLCPGTVLL